MSRRGFPDGFLWGAGTSAHQVEGGNTRNDWWRFEQEGKVARGETSGDACDHYHLYPEDFTLARELGHTAHKLSLEWSRIEPSPGRYDEHEIAHYRRVLGALRDNGLEPFVTLHHFTDPVWFADRGGWDRREAPDEFAAFASVVGEALGDLSDTWITVNEPMLVAGFGYVSGYWPPERRDIRAGFRVASNLMRAHRAAYDALKGLRPRSRVGVAVNATVFGRSKRRDWREALLTPALDRLANLYFMDRVKDRCDFVGVQYYSRMTVRQLLRREAVAELRDQRPVSSDMGWEVYPEGLYKVLMRLHRRYGLPLYVTENGVADAEDRIRRDFIRDHLEQAHRAITEGADVRGYLHWALLDNFEWREGFSPRFGLVEVDYATQERRVRPSALYYRDICVENALRFDVRPGDDGGE